MIGNLKSLLSFEVSSSQSGDIDWLGKTLWIAALISASFNTLGKNPSNIAICCDAGPRHRYLVYELMTGGDIYDRLLKSRKRQNPVAFHWPGGPKESKDTGYINIKYQRTSMKIWRWTHDFGQCDKMCPDFQTSNSLFLPKTAISRGMKDWVPCWMQHLAFPICTIPSQRRFIGWKPQIHGGNLRLVGGNLWHPRILRVPTFCWIGRSLSFLFLYRCLWWCRYISAELYRCSTS